MRRAELNKLVSVLMRVQLYVSRSAESLMSDPAGYPPLRRLAGIQIPWQLVDKNACRRLALLIGKSAFIALLYYPGCDQHEAPLFHVRPGPDLALKRTACRNARTEPERSLVGLLACNHSRTYSGNEFL